MRPSDVESLLTIPEVVQGDLGPLLRWSSTYPTRADQRVWHKLKARETLELVCTAVAGSFAERPTAVAAQLARKVSLPRSATPARLGTRPGSVPGRP